MMQAFDTLLANPVVLLATLAAGAAIGMGVEKFWTGIELEKRRAYWRGRKSGRARPKGATLMEATSRAANGKNR